MNAEGGDKTTGAHLLRKEVSMSEFFSKAVPFARRVLAHDAVKKGLLSAAAGIIVAAASEALAERS